MARGEAPPTAGLLPKLPDLFGMSAPQSFERDIAQFLGIDDFILTCSGTAALVVAFNTLKEMRPPGTEITGYTCPLVVFASREAGLKAIACDTAPGSIDFDTTRLRAHINGQTLAVVPTHFGGALANVAAVREVVQSTGQPVFIIEDAAQAFGARVGDTAAGLAGDIGIYSFAAGKGLTMFEGGGLAASKTVPAEALRLKARDLLRPSFAWEIRRSLELAAYHALYNRRGLSLAYGAEKRRHLANDDEIRAAGDHFTDAIPMHTVGAWRASVGRRALMRLPQHLAASTQRFEHLARRIGSLPGVTVLAPRPSERPSATYLMMLMPTAEASRAALKELWPRPLGVSKAFTRAIGDYPQLSGCLASSDTPNSRSFAARMLTLTTSTLLFEEEVDEICLALVKHSV